MNTSFIITLSIIISLLIAFYTFLLALNNKVHKLEILIKDLLKQRTDLIPALFEITKNYLTKHNEIYDEILRLRKLEFSLEDNEDVTFVEILKNERFIHHEMNFIYNVCLKNKKLEQFGRFQYIKELTINRSYTIGEKVETYRKIVDTLNNLITIKNYTIIGLFLPLNKRIEI
nr:hypothetical protein [Candidatus Gracilibacteria bacterium]